MSRAWTAIQKHYDIGNDLFKSFLDSNMQYSCGYWKNADNLEQAQKDKMELIAKKLMLKPGMRVLDIGCGWGGLCQYLAENYGVSVVGCTISEEGAKYARNLCADNSLVDIRLIDYRDLDEKFDRIVSIEMFEHVGPANYRTFFEVVHRCLVDDGIFLFQTTGVNHKKIMRATLWINTYIFPNGVLPYHIDILKKTDDLFILEDWQNISVDYSKTLMAWYENFDKAWPKLSHVYGERFYRIWKYYLLMFAGAFRSRKLQLWQIVLTKDGFKGGYNAPR